MICYLLRVFLLQKYFPGRTSKFKTLPLFIDHRESHLISTKIITFKLYIMRQLEFFFNENVAFLMVQFFMIREYLF